MLFTLNFHGISRNNVFSAFRREVSGYSISFDDYFDEILPMSQKSPAKAIQDMNDKLWDCIEHIRAAETYEGVDKTAAEKHSDTFRFTLYKRQPKGINNEIKISGKGIVSSIIEFDPTDDKEVAKAIFSVMAKILKHPNSFLVGSYNEGDVDDDDTRVDFVYADVYGLYDRNWLDASGYGSDNLGGHFFYRKYKDQLRANGYITNGYYTESIIGDWGDTESWFAFSTPLYKFFEEGEFIPLSKFHDHEDPDNAVHFATAEEYALFRLALYFADLYGDTKDSKYDIFTWESHGDNEIIIGFEYHDFTTTEQWTEWKDSSERFKMYSFKKD